MQLLSVEMVACRSAHFSLLALWMEVIVLLLCALLLVRKTSWNWSFDSAT